MPNCIQLHFSGRTIVARIVCGFNDVCFASFHILFYLPIPFPIIICFTFTSCVCVYILSVWTVSRVIVLLAHENSKWKNEENLRFSIANISVSVWWILISCWNIFYIQVVEYPYHGDEQSERWVFLPTIIRYSIPFTITAAILHLKFTLLLDSWSLTQTHRTQTAVDWIIFQKPTTEKWME